MGRAREIAVVPLPPHEARALWTDLRRWPTFVDGFARVLEPDPAWPEAGAKLVWESRPGGRGRVTERVTASDPGRIVTEVFEESLTGTQSVSFTPDPEGARVEVELDYTLSKGGPLRALTDLIFIRGALTASLGRTLRRFAVEAEEESALQEGAPEEGAQ